MLRGPCDVLSCYRLRVACDSDVLCVACYMSRDTCKYLIINKVNADDTSPKLNDVLKITPHTPHATCS